MRRSTLYIKQVYIVSRKGNKKIYTGKRSKLDFNVRLRRQYYYTQLNAVIKLLNCQPDVCPALLQPT